MVRVTREWIKYCVQEWSAPFEVSSIDEYTDEKMFETTLTSLGVRAIELIATDRPFSIVIPGHGIVKCWGYTEETEQERLDLWYDLGGIFGPVPNFGVVE